MILSSASGGCAPRPRVWDLLLPQLQAPQHPQLSDPSTAYEKLFKVYNALVIDSLGKTRTYLVLMEIKHNALSCYHAM